MVKLLRAFGARVLVHDPYIQLSADDVAAGVKLAGFEQLLAEADVVTLHARVTPETTRMMNAEAFARMKPDAIFVNTARGPLCDYDALYAALSEGRLAGAMLETFGVEPVPADWPLLQLPERHADAAYRRRFRAHRDDRRRAGGRGGAALSRRRGAAQPVLRID